ncbi:hypothetical protein Fluta_0656 [Sporocytophaga myxococcoides]|uniref:Lipoprotein n=1 Tax=Sporocytophaga myxococcoides TaxID=153721 RepID=A0A098LHB2_9BACT|nr:hypothetical protein [Sporocytophaga myxococcoides]GAL85802.1 hypothetical protein Fluta_0656 [Sporocytophaga myxococcoides]
MRHILSLILILLLVSCSSEKVSKEQQEQTITAKKSTINKHIEVSNDCIFDTSTFKFTSEAIHKFNPKIKFHWNENEKHAILPLEDGDSLILHIGGCNHFSYWAKYRTDYSKFNDSIYLLNKAKWIAENFFDNGFDKNYVRFITDKKYYQEDNGRPLMKSYSIQTDKSIQENEIYEGFYFMRDGERTEIWIHGYVN